jgi:AraC-like DNA-binding protein
VGRRSIVVAPRVLRPTPGQPCPCCGQRVPVARVTTPVLARVEDAEHERRQWIGRTAQRLVTWFAPESDAFRFVMAAAERSDAEHVGGEGGRDCSTIALADDLGVLPTTLMSRFSRAGLPSPATVRRAFTCYRLAALAEAYPGESSARLSSRAGFTVPQNFCRFIRGQRGVTPSAWLRDASEDREWAWIERELVAPHAAAWRAAPLLAADVAAARRLASRRQRSA